MIPHITALAMTQASPTPSVRTAADSLTVEALTKKHEREVLAFLAERPLHTVIMVGFIRDNGLISPLNRGTFYACRDAEGRLEGVALIGHATLVETRSEAAIEVFARLAQNSPLAHMIMGEQEKIEAFWHYYSDGGRAPRLVCRELLLEQKWPVEVREPVPGLRLATLDDLHLVMPVHAQMAFEESGVNPMEKDPVGFRLRCARRIEQGRTWIWIENGRLIFKADVVADTPDACYLEGIYVNPDERGKGYGTRCLSQLSRSLLSRTGSVGLLVNENNQQGQGLYRKAGYKLRSCYDTIFLHQKSDQ
jgi:ribosomal protein S18 acetylase RimI-like enzyme